MATFKEQLTTDLDAFLNDDEFAYTATLTVGAAVTTPIVQIFKPGKEFSPLSGAVETSAPWAIIKTSDLGAAVHGSTIAIDGTTYYIIGIEPYGDDGILKSITLSEVAP